MGNHLKLHESEKDFKEAIQATAKHFKIREVFVEKDYWVTFVLKNIKESSFAKKIVFKGGTSISKAYGIAKRFSEDIDLAIVPIKNSKRSNEEVFRSIENEIAKNPLTEKKEKSFLSRNTFYKLSHWEYPKVTDGLADPAKDQIQLELTTNAKTSPKKVKKIQTLVAEYLIAERKIDLVKEYELEKFSISVLSHKRTFAEKILAIANSCHKDPTLATLGSKVRHLFDLTVLFKDPEIKDFVDSKEFLKMINQAVKSDIRIPNLKEIASKPWQSAIIFKSPKKILALIKKQYEEELTPFVFSKAEMPKIKDIEKMLVMVVKAANKI